MTKDEKKELYDIAATAFVASYKSDIAFYELGKTTGIYVEFENEAASHGIEKILEALFPQSKDIVSALCDLASDGEVALSDLNSEDGVIMCYTINEIWDVYTEGE